MEELLNSPWLRVVNVISEKLPMIYPSVNVPRENSEEYFEWMDRRRKIDICAEVEYADFQTDYRKEWRRLYRQGNRRYRLTLRYVLFIQGCYLYSSGSWDPLLLFTPDPSLELGRELVLEVEYTTRIRIGPIFRSIPPPALSLNSLLTSVQRFRYVSSPRTLIGRSLLGWEFYLPLGEDGKIIPGKYDLVSIIQSQQEYLRFEAQLNPFLTLEDPTFDGETYQGVLRTLIDRHIQSTLLVGEVLYVNLALIPSLGRASHLVQLPPTVLRITIT